MADQAMYHQGNQSVFVGGRLWTLLPPPAENCEETLVESCRETKPANLEKREDGTGFTSIEMVHTHTPAFTRFHTHTHTHTDPLTHRSFYTQTLLHTDAFSHRRFYTQAP